MSILEGILRSRFMRPQFGVKNRTPSFEARARFMEAMGRSPIEAIFAAKAGVTLGAPGPDPAQAARDRRDLVDQQAELRRQERQEDFERRQEAEAEKTERERTEREEAFARLGGGDETEAELRAAGAKPIDIVRHRIRQKALREAQQQKTAEGVGRGISRGVSRIGKFVEGVRGDITKGVAAGRKLKATQERERQEAFEKETREAEEHEARVQALLADERRGLTPEQAEAAAAGRITPLAPLTERAPVDDFTAYKQFLQGTLVLPPARAAAPDEIQLLQTKTPDELNQALERAIRGRRLDDAALIKAAIDQEGVFAPSGGPGFLTRIGQGINRFIRR